MAQKRAPHAPPVHAVVLEEPLVLDGEERLLHGPRHGLEPHHLPLDGGQGREDLALAIEELRRAPGLIRGQPVDVGAAAEPAARPENSRHEGKEHEGRRQRDREQHAGGAAAPPTTRPGEPMRPKGRGRAEAGRGRPTHHQHPITPQQTHTELSSLYARRLEDMGLKTLLTGGASELGQPDLLRKVVDGILKLRRHGGRGIEVLPEEVQVRIKVGEGGVQAIKTFLEDPSFDREVEASLLNRLVHAREDRMPVRHYSVEAGDRTSVEVTETPATHAAVPRRRRVTATG